MPPTEQCPLGAENKANIENLEKNLDDFKLDVKRYMENTSECLKKLTNHYSQRPTWIVALLITALVGLCVWLIQLNIERKYEPFQHPQQKSSQTQDGAEKTPGPP